MLRFLADDNFSHFILRGVRQRRPDIDILTVQQVGLTRAKDPVVLEWAAQAGRIMLTHDVSTMTAFAYARTRAGQRMPGLFEVNRGAPLDLAIEEIILVAVCSHEDEWENQVRYIPLQT